MKNWEWMNEGDKEPKTFEQMLVEGYTDHVIGIMKYKLKRDRVRSMSLDEFKKEIQSLDTYEIYCSVKNWLNNEHKEG